MLRCKHQSTWNINIYLFLKVNKRICMPQHEIPYNELPQTLKFKILTIMHYSDLTRRKLEITRTPWAEAVPREWHFLWCLLNFNQFNTKSFMCHYLKIQSQIRISQNQPQIKHISEWKNSRQIYQFLTFNFLLIIWSAALWCLLLPFDHRLSPIHNEKIFQQSKAWMFL